MQFSRVRLTGFKSFVDPTELVIEPGLTGIVGPNGCGKSNLLEAIRWAMGESSAKSLRGSGMEDVIFAGTGKRPPRHMAEVSLVLDNALRTAPSQYNADDLIEVTRRIERDSGSAYRINGGDVRQKDVQLLFADAATGAHSPALVSQGRIGALISARARERRMVLEEAAGISGLHVRRKEAEQRLRAAENNLARVQDVLTGMENQASTLKKQARQAERYRKLTEDIEKTEAALLYVRWAMAAADVIEGERMGRDVLARAGETAELLARATKVHEELAASIEPYRQAAIEAQAALQRIELARDRLDGDEERRAETEARLKLELETAKGDLAREAERRDDATAMLTRISSELAELKAQVDQATDAEAEAEAAVKEIVEKAGGLEAAYDEKAQILAGAKARRTSLESDLLAVRRRRDQVTIEKERLEARRAALLEADDTQQKKIAADEAVSQLTGQLDAIQKDLEAAETATETALQTREDARRANSEIEGELRSLDGAITGLEKLVAATEQRLAATVLKDVKADAGYELALGAALTDLEDTGTDTASSRYLTALGAWPANSSVPSGCVPLAGHVTVPRELDRLIASTFILSDEAQLGTVQQSLLPGQQVVTPAGGLFRADGLVVTSGADSKTAALLTDQNRLKDMRADQQALAAKAEKAAADLEAATSTLNTAREKAAAVKQQAQGLDRDLVDARRQLIAAEAEAAKKQGEAQNLDTALARAADDEKAQEKRYEEVEKQIADLPATDTLESEIVTLKSQVDLARQEVATARARFDGQRREQLGRLDQIKRLEADQQAWAERDKRAGAQSEALNKRLAEAGAALGSVAADPEAFAAKRAQLLNEIETAKETRNKAQEALDQSEGGLREAAVALKQAEQENAQAREAQIRAEASLEAVVDRRKAAAAAVGERFQTQPTALLERFDLPPADDLPPIAKLEEDFERQKRDRERLGAVNLRADIELQEQMEQYDHLNGERQEIETAIGRLRGVIGSLNRQGRERLLAAFEVVNAHFKELFTGLFGGGEARLALVDSDDPLEAGLEIFASPPDKKMQVLSLLSGGEQALTALSLIFAVFITNPAPICILDEVDAPLDDANVERFCNLLKTMVDRTDTRFLIVTHNAVTMSRVSRLFGVTMAERGVSKLVSVDLDKATDLISEDT